MHDGDDDDDDGPTDGLSPLQAASSPCTHLLFGHTQPVRVRSTDAF